MTAFENKIAKSLNAYKRTIAHLPADEQGRRIARRRESLLAEARNVHVAKARKAGVDAGFDLKG